MGGDPFLATEAGPADEMGGAQGEQLPHVLVFPFPAQGHVTSMLKLAELLSLSGLHVTFLNTEHNHQRLLSFAGVQDRLSRRPGLRLRSIPDGLPPDHPRTLVRILDLHESLNTKAKPLFSNLLTSTGRNSDGSPPVTCVVADGLLGFTVDVAEELGIPIIAFRTSSACSFWAYFRIPELIQNGELPFQDGCDMDELLRSVPGMEGFLRRRDLPSLCRAKEVSDPALQWVCNITHGTTRARGLIFNTMEHLEAPVLSHIRSYCPNTYTIGPLHALLKTLDSHPIDDGNSASLWQEDRTCMAWLDSQPHRSVVYVSFGSVTVVNRGELLEFWHGLVNSGQRFLWVVRPGLLDGEDGVGEVPVEVADGTKERGFLVEWAPQQEVLSHQSVGGFLTHSGWNSTLESMYAGVPMICWPFFVDQQINSRFVEEIWKIGLDMKDTCNRSTVEKMVRELMEGERDGEMRKSAGEMARLVRACVGEGGSSFLNLKKLIQDIISMSSEAF